MSGYCERLYLVQKVGQSLHRCVALSNEKNLMFAESVVAFV